MSKRQRHRKIDSVRERKEIEGLYRQAYEAVKGMMDRITKDLNNEDSAVSDEKIRFLKKSQGIIDSLKARLVSIERGEEEEASSLSEGSLRDFIDRLGIQMELYQKAFSTKYMNQDNVYTEIGYYRCKACNNLHVDEIKCPWIKLANEYGIVVNESLTEVLSRRDKIEEEEEGVLVN